MVKKTLLWSVVVLVAIMGFIALGWLHGKGEQNRRHEGFVFPQSALERKLAKRIGLVYPPQYNMSEAQSNELASALEAISRAYDGGEVKQLRDRMQACPQTMTNISDWVFVALSRPLCKNFGERFLMAEPMKDFTELNDFKNYVELNFEMARFFGGIDLARGGYSGYLILLDKCTLKQLKRYKDKFHTEGQKELEACADKYIAEWIDQIESENGFTRKYMRFQVRLQYGRVEEERMTYEQLLDAVRDYATGLVRGGYTPKWLDEEFPPPPEEKSASPTKEVPR